jgi:putative glutamine amidotransferase
MERRVRAPFVGITAEGRDDKGNVILPLEYVDAVRRAGGVAVILPVWQADPALLLAAVDALIIAGGGDIDPVLYGGEAHPAIYSIDRERDDVEIALVRQAFETGTPTLGICRGAQVMNVALGGTLVEHLEDSGLGSTRHRASPPAYVPHRVDVLEGSTLHYILAATVIAPLSWHHQAVRRLAPGLIASACAPDDTIEAIESNRLPYFLAVQWHPEMSAVQDPTQQRLFDALVEAARDFVSRRTVRFHVESRQ